MATWVQIAFQIALIANVVLLAVTYYCFFRMGEDVRNARMFLMAARFQRFLLAFIVGFGAAAVRFMNTVVGHSIPEEVSTASVFVFLGTVTYGALELFFVARPKPPSKHLRANIPAPRSGDSPKVSR
jgi:hypothetical protein